MDDRTNVAGLRTSEFLALVILPTLLVLTAPLFGYNADPDRIDFLLVMYGGYGGLRGGKKIASIVKQPKQESAPKGA